MMPQHNGAASDSRRSDVENAVDGGGGSVTAEVQECGSAAVGPGRPLVTTSSLVAT